MAELDATLFLESQEEWEIELECHDVERGDTVLRGHLEAAGVSYRSQTLSKSARLYAIMEARRSEP